MLYSILEAQQALSTYCFISELKLRTNTFTSRPGKSNATKISTVKVDEEFECAQEAIFKAVEKTEKAVFGAVQDEVKLIFCPPGDFHYNKRAPCKNTETGNAVKVAISSPSKATLTKGCLEQPDITSRNECIKELLTGNFE